MPGWYLSGRACSPATSSAWRSGNALAALSVRREREVELPESAENVRRLVGVLAVVGRSVFDLVDLDVCHPVQNAFEGDAALHAGQRSARARVDAAGKGHVLAHVLAVEVELVRVFEAARVAI